MQANDAPSTQAGEAISVQSNGAVQTLEAATDARRRAANGRQKTTPAARKPRKSAAAARADKA